MFVACLCTIAACGNSTISGTSSASITRIKRGEEAILFPVRAGGRGGWCLVRAGLAGSVCPTASLPAFEGPFQGPIIIERWSGQGPSPAALSFSALVLTTNSVAAVIYGKSKPIRTHALANLSNHLRGAVVELHGRPLHVAHSRSALIVGRLPRSRLIALDARGHEIPESRRLGPPLEFQSRVQIWKKSQPNVPTKSVCDLKVNGLSGLNFEGGDVMTMLKPHRNVRGQEFVDCIHATYLFNGWPLEVDLLLNAANPGASPPPLPVMEPLRGHSGIVHGPIGGDEIVARWMHNSWLLVSGGQDRNQRLTVLESLHGSVFSTPRRME